MGIGAQQRLANVRDLGGLTTVHGDRVRHGVLLRSDVPRVGDSDPDLIAWPPTVVLDLRTELDLEPEHPLAQAVTRIVRIPMTPEADPRRMLADDNTLTLAELYQKILDALVPNLNTIVDAVLNADGPALVHCVAGKDRTGVLIAVLLAAVGVSRSHIEADYCQTGDNMVGVLERMMTTIPEAKRSIFRAKVANAPAGLFDTPVDVIATVLDQLDAYPGGPGGWLIEHGVAPEQLSRLRRHLIG